MKTFEDQPNAHQQNGHPATAQASRLRFMEHMEEQRH
jgi:hypothetical protein